MKITFRIPSFAAQVVIESDLYTTRPLELLPHRSERRDGEARRPGRFQNARQQGPHPAKTPTRPGTCVAARVPGTALGALGHLGQLPRCLRPRSGQPWRPPARHVVRVQLPPSPHVLSGPAEQPRQNPFFLKTLVSGSV